jgi:hypothetical protein
MDELTLLREFRSTVGAPSEVARERARAAIAPRSPRRNRRFVLALAAGLALTAILAGAAFGLGERLYDFIIGNPAPPPVKREVSMLVHPRPQVLEAVGTRMPGVDVGAMRAGAALQSSEGPVYVWVAPNRRGGPCAFLEVARTATPAGRAGLVNGQCYPPNLTLIGLVTEIPVGKRILGLINGRVGPNVARVELRFKEGQPMQIPLTGRFFLAEYPAARTPIGLVAFADSGHILQEQPLHEPNTLPPNLTPHGPERVAVELPSKAGVSAQVFAYIGEAGVRCTRLAFGRFSAGGPCEDNIRNGLAVAEARFGPAPKTTVLFNGFAAPNVTEVRMVFENGGAEPARLADGIFLIEITPDHFVQGRRPSLLEGLDASGKQVASFRPGPWE